MDYFCNVRWAGAPSPGRFKHTSAGSRSPAETRGTFPATSPLLEGSRLGGLGKFYSRNFISPAKFGIGLKTHHN